MSLPNFALATLKYIINMDNAFLDQGQVLQVINILNHYLKGQAFLLQEEIILSEEEDNRRKQMIRKMKHPKPSQLGHKLGHIYDMDKKSTVIHLSCNIARMSAWYLDIVPIVSSANIDRDANVVMVGNGFCIYFCFMVRCHDAASSRQRQTVD